MTHRRALAIGAVAWIAVMAATSHGTAAEPTAKIVHMAALERDPGATPTTDATSGAVHLIGTPPVHFQTTRRIPCAVGQNFGFTVELQGLQPGRQYTLHDVTRHPQIMQPSGQILKKSTSDQIFTAWSGRTIRGGVGALRPATNTSSFQDAGRYRSRSTTSHRWKWPSTSSAAMPPTNRKQSSRSGRWPAVGLHCVILSVIHSADTVQVNRARHEFESFRRTSRHIKCGQNQLQDNRHARA